MAEAAKDQAEFKASDGAELTVGLHRVMRTTSLESIWAVLVRRRSFVGFTLSGIAVVCLLYCALAPREYEARARVALRSTPPSSLSTQDPAAMSSRLLATPDVQVETLATKFKSGQLAWRLISDLKLYEDSAFTKSFKKKFPDFREDHSSSETQSYLLDRFENRLSVQPLPRSLILEIRFRSTDPRLSADVVNGLIREYVDEDREKRIAVTRAQATWLTGQLSQLKIRVDEGDRQLAKFQRDHGLIDSPAGGTEGQAGDTQHNAALLEIDALGKELAAATAERILLEADYQAAQKGDPEQVMAADQRGQALLAGFGMGLPQQLRAHKSDLEQEESQLRLEHGPNFPRLVEIRSEMSELDRQIALEDGKLVSGFRDAWQTSRQREELVRQSLASMTKEGMKLNEAALEFEVLRAESSANHELYLRLEQKAEEAGIESGIEDPEFVVIDPARAPAKSASPDLPFCLAVTLFVGFWLTMGGAFTLENISKRKARTLAVLLLAIACAGRGIAQAPTPSTSGLPTGVAHPPAANDGSSVKSQDAPVIWGSGQGASLDVSSAPSGSPMAMPAAIEPGDMVEVREMHTPEFRTVGRIDDAGQTKLPLIGAIELAGLSEREAEQKIEAELVVRGMLLHPQVAVLVTAFVGQDVTVLGEVARPGIYPYTVHHRLLDLISAASGFTTSAGSLITVQHRNLSQTPEALVVPRSAQAGGGGANPELKAGDIVQVQRAGLVYVVGDVLRPGGFAADPVQRLTVLQVLALAWGPSQSANLGKALLIREQAGGRTVTQLNLKRLMRGQDPDEMVMDRDILFVPNAAVKNLLNRSVDSVVQSAAGVSIYAGMVYSQRF